MEKGLSLAKKTCIYALGNIGSKILAYIMVLVYSYYILPAELGYYDIVLTTISMLQPLVLFQINDGVYRYLVDAKSNIRKIIIANGFQFLCLSVLLADILFVIICYFYHVEYSITIILLFMSTMFYTYLQDVVRGLGDSKFYAGIGVVNSVIMLICEAIGLIIFHMGVLALLVSKVLANIICIVLLLFKKSEIQSVFSSKISAPIMKPLLIYSAPLVPNTICWWIVNSSNRYIILSFLGTSFNGLFSMASRFPTVLTTIASIFFLAWQETAIKEYNTPERDIFFSAVFQKYYVLLYTLCICAIPITRIVIELFVAAEYKQAWYYTGFLYMGAAFSALCSFLGMGYQISKETGKSFVTTVYAAIINLLVNIGLVQFIGLHAASIATFLAYFSLFIIRIIDTKKYFTLKVNWAKFNLLFMVVLFMVAVVGFIDSLYMCYVMCFFSIIVLYYYNFELIVSLKNKILKF